MMTEDHRQLRAALAAETLLTGSLQSQRSLSSLTRTIDDMPSEDLIAGARPNGSISNVRRFFCLLVTFDLFFTALVWLICTMIAGESIQSAFENQIVHYQWTTSLFDIVMAATCRFTVLILFYALLHLNHRLIIAISTACTCAFLIAKVSLYDWSQSHQPAFQGFLIITSFVLAWGEAWFFDYRVIPQEMAANSWILAGSYDPERRPLIRHLLDDPMGRVENPANFFTPLDSPNHSEGEGDDGHTDIGISAGSVEDPGSKIPVMARLTPARSIEMLTTTLLAALFGQNTKNLRHFLFGAMELTRDYVEKDWFPGDGIISFKETHETIEEYKTTVIEVVDRTRKLLTSKEWTIVKTTPNGDIISAMECNYGKIMKIEGLIDAPASELRDCLYEGVDDTPAWNKHVWETKRMQEIDRNTDITYQSTKSQGGGLISPRDFITLRHRARIDDYYTISGVSIRCPSIPPRKNFIRGENDLVCWATEAIEGDIEQGTPGKCRFTWIVNTNLKGWVPRRLIDKSLAIALIEFMDFLRHHVRDLTDVTA